MNPNGIQQWYQHGKLHRTDGPANMTAGGNQYWHINGKETKPVIPILIAAGARPPWHVQPEVVTKLSEPEIKKNIMRWLTRTARTGGNADAAINALKKIGVRWPELKSIAADIEASKQITEDDDTLPTVWRSDGYKAWYHNHKLHREDGPALIDIDGTRNWYKNGERHREDGPARIFQDGEQMWYQNGQKHRTDGPAVIRPDGSQEWYYDGQEKKPIIPIMLGAGATRTPPRRRQPRVVAKLSEPEIKKNIMRWLTRTARAGGDVDTAINALREIGVKWPELETFTSDTGVPK